MDDGDGVISDHHRHFHFLSVNSLYEETFLGLHVVTMIGNTVIALSE